MTGEVLQRIQPQVEDAERHLSSSPSPSMDLAFSSSLSQLLMEWLLLDKSKLSRFIAQYPRTCCVIGIREDPKNFSAVFQTLCETDGIIRCRDILCNGCAAFQPRVRSDALATVIGECLAHTVFGTENQENCQLVFRSMICTLTRKLCFSNEAHNDNWAVFSVLLEAMAVASRRVHEEGSRAVVPLILEPVYKFVLLEYLHCICKSLNKARDGMHAKVPTSSATERYLAEAKHGFVSFEDIATMSRSMDCVVEIFRLMPAGAQCNAWSSQTHPSLWVLSAQQAQERKSRSQHEHGRSTSKLPWWVQLLHPRLSQARPQQAWPVSIADLLCPDDIHAVLARASVATAAESGGVRPWRQCPSLLDAEGSALEHEGPRGAEDPGGTAALDALERVECSKMCLLLSLHDSLYCDTGPLQTGDGGAGRKGAGGEASRRGAGGFGEEGGGQRAWLLGELPSREQLSRVLTLWEEVVRAAGRRRGSLSKAVWWMGMHCLLRAGSLRGWDGAQEHGGRQIAGGGTRAEGGQEGWSGATWRGEWDGMGAVGLVKEVAVRRAREEVRRAVRGWAAVSAKGAGAAPAAGEASSDGEVSEVEWLGGMGSVVLHLMAQSRGQYRHCLQTYLRELGRAEEQMRGREQQGVGDTDAMAMVGAHCPMYLGALLGATPERRREDLFHAVLWQVGQDDDIVRPGSEKMVSATKAEGDQEEEDDLVILEVPEHAKSSPGGRWYAKIGSRDGEHGRASWLSAMVREREASFRRWQSKSPRTAALVARTDARSRMEGLTEWWWCAVQLREEQALDDMLSLAADGETESRSDSAWEDRRERSVYVLDAVKAWCALLNDEESKLTEQSSWGRVHERQKDVSGFQDRFALVAGACDKLVVRRARLAKLLPHMLPAVDALSTAVQTLAALTSSVATGAAPDPAVQTQPSPNVHGHKPVRAGEDVPAKRGRPEASDDAGDGKRRKTAGSDGGEREGMADTPKQSAGLLRYLMAGPSTSRTLLNELAEGTKDKRKSMGTGTELLNALGEPVAASNARVLRYLQEVNPWAAAGAAEDVLRRLYGQAAQGDDGDVVLRKRRRARELLDVAKQSTRPERAWQVLSSLCSTEVILDDAKLLVRALVDGVNVDWSGKEGVAAVNRLAEAERDVKGGLAMVWLQALQGCPEDGGKSAWATWSHGVSLALRVLSQASEEAASRLVHRLALGVRAAQWQLGTAQQRLVAVLFTGEDALAQEVRADSKHGRGGSSAGNAISSDGENGMDFALATWLVSFPYSAFSGARTEEDSSEDCEQGAAQWVGPGSGLRGWWKQAESTRRAGGGWQALSRALRVLEAHGMWSSGLKQRLVDLVASSLEGTQPRVLLQAQNLEAVACHDSRGFLDELRCRVAALPQPREDAAVEVCRWSGAHRTLHKRAPAQLVTDLEAGAWVRAAAYGGGDGGLSGTPSRTRGAAADLLEQGVECGRAWAEKGWCEGYSGGLGALLCGDDAEARRRAVEIVCEVLVGRGGGVIDGARKMQVVVAQECAETAGRLEHREQCEALVALVRHSRWGAKGRVYGTPASSMWEEWLEGVTVKVAQGLVREITPRDAGRGGGDVRPEGQAWERIGLTVSLLKELLWHAGAVEKASGSGLVRGIAAVVTLAACDVGEGSAGAKERPRVAAGAAAVDCLVHLAAGGEGAAGIEVQAEAWEALGGVGLGSVAVGGSERLWGAMECGLLSVVQSNGARRGESGEQEDGGLVERVRTALERCGEEEVRTFCRLSRLLLRLEP